MYVRAMALTDFDAVLEMAKAVYRELAPYQKYSFDVDFIRRRFEVLLQGIEGTEFFCGIVASGSDILGFGYFVTAEQFFSSDRVAADVIVYIKPEYRGTVAVFKLLRRYVEWAESLGVVSITLGHSVTEINPQIPQMYERIGFRRVGTMFDWPLGARTPEQDLLFRIGNQ